MNYSIDRGSSEPAYIQLYRMLVKDIESGAYPYGSKLPSKRTIADETGLSLITVEHAISLLNEEGYIEGRIRSGNIITYRNEDFLGSVRREEEAAFDTAILSDYTGDFPFTVLTKTMRKVILDYGDRILTKSPNKGCSELRGEICLYLARSRGIHVKASQIILGSGAEYLYGLIVQLLGNDRIYAIEDPSYSKIEKVYRSMGVSLDKLTLSADGISSTALNATKAKVLHVTPFNSYPSGVTADVSKKHEYLRWAHRHNGVIVEDNYDSELTVSRKEHEPLFTMDDEADVIYLNTFSRTVAPSVRIGYMILPEKMLDMYEERLGFYSCTVPIFDQYVLAELIKNGDFERHINKVRRRRRKEQT